MYRLDANLNDSSIRHTKKGFLYKSHPTIEVDSVAKSRGL
jgi:hypothetical protein